MEQSRNEKPVATTLDYCSNIDTSHPISSVKNAVAFFGEQSLVGEIYSRKPFTASPHNLEKEQSWKYSSASPKVSSYSYTKLAETVNKLKIELEQTKVEFQLLKEREIEAEVGLASLKAELHKNMSKLARAKAAMASAVMMSIGGENIDYGNIQREEEKKKESVGEKEEGPFLGWEKGKEIDQKKAYYSTHWGFV